MCHPPQRATPHQHSTHRGCQNDESQPRYQKPLAYCHVDKAATNHYWAYQSVQPPPIYQPKSELGRVPIPHLVFHRQIQTTHYAPSLTPQCSKPHHLFGLPTGRPCPAHNAQYAPHNDAAWCYGGSPQSIWPRDQPPPVASAKTTPGLALRHHHSQRQSHRPCQVASYQNQPQPHNRGQGRHKKQAKPVINGFRLWHCYSPIWSANEHLHSQYDRRSLPQRKPHPTICY